MVPVVIVSTFPDKRSAEVVARTLVKDRVAACVNITAVSSIYSWKGKVEDSEECLAIFKTGPRNRDLLKRRILETHPYDVPEVAEIAMASVNGPYMDWITESTC